MLTQERAEKLVEYLANDEARAKKLVSMSAEEAVIAINKVGFDFSLEELRVFGEEISKVAEQVNGELDVEQLDEVAGGISINQSRMTPYFRQFIQGYMRKQNWLYAIAEKCGRW